MARSSRPVAPGEQAPPTAWARRDAVLFALLATSVALIALQFAFAGFAAFTMDKTPSDNAYGAHAVLGLLIAAMTLLILGAVVASPAARAHRRTLWLAIILVVLAVAVQPALGDGGTHVPVLGALHALNGLLIFAVAGLLTRETARRRAAASEPAGTAPADAGAQADWR
jgi:hypothetical protein